MGEIIIENLVQVAVALLLTLVGVLGTWLTGKIGKRAELLNLQLAVEALFGAVSCTVSELQQTVVDGMKAAAADGKLSEEEMRVLRIKLYDGALRKLNPAAMGVLNAAGMDLSELIRGFGEAIVQGRKA